MRIFRSVVAPPPAFMAMGDPKITSGRTVRSKVIGHNLVRNKANFPEQFPHQFQCSPLVPLALHENVEDLALSIDGTPQVDQPAIDFDEYLVKVPSGMRLGPASSKVSCDHGTEVFHPATHRLIGNDDPALSQQVLDIAKAEAEPGIEPDGLLNDHGGKAVSGVADLGHNGRLPPGITADKPNNVTVPAGALLPHRREGSIDLARVASIDNKELPAEQASCFVRIAEHARGFRKFRVRHQGDDNSIGDELEQQPQPFGLRLAT
jgi:hypothetical protein